MRLNTMTILIYVKQNVKQYKISLFRDLNKTICSIVREKSSKNEMNPSKKLA